MAKIYATGVDRYLQKLERLNKNTDAVCKQTVYAGAKVVGDAIVAAIDAMPVQEPPEKQPYFFLSDAARESGTLITGVSEAQKQGLREGFGIAQMAHEDNSWNTKIGFDGYNSVKTKTYPKGQPNALIARSVEGGTSIQQKTPFIAPTVRQARKAAQKAMEETMAEKVQEIMDK